MAQQIKDRISLKLAGFHNPFKVIVRPKPEFMDRDEVILDAYCDWLLDRDRPGVFTLYAFREWRGSGANKHGVVMLTNREDLAFEFKMRWA